MNESLTAGFVRVGGRLVIDLLNTVGARDGVPVDLLDNPEDLPIWADVVGVPYGGDLGIRSDAELTELREFREVLRDVLDKGAVQEHTLSIILFGSNARGDARPTSDVDLLVVVVDEPAVERVQEVLLGAVADIHHRFGFRIAPYALSRERVQERFRDGDPLMQNIHSEGRTLYGTHFQEIVGVW